MSRPLRPIIILDDNPDDIFLLERVIERAGAENPRAVFLRSEDAIRHLANITADCDPAHPAMPIICFLDLVLSDLSGIEFIEWVRQHEAFKTMALVITSGSDDPRHIWAAAKQGAQCYVLKYPTASIMREILKEAEAFFLSETGVFEVRGNLLLARKARPHS
jgi:two-component system response regulator